MIGFVFTLLLSLEVALAQGASVQVQLPVDGADTQALRALKAELKKIDGVADAATAPDGIAITVREDKTLKLSAIRQAAEKAKVKLREKDIRVSGKVRLALEGGKSADYYGNAVTALAMFGSVTRRGAVCTLECAGSKSFSLSELNKAIQSELPSPEGGTTVLAHVGDVTWFGPPKETPPPKGSG